MTTKSKTKARKVQDRNQWLTSLINRTSKSPYKAFSSRLQVLRDQQEILDNAGSWFFLPVDGDHYQFAVVSKVDKGITKHNFNTNAVESFRLLNALVRERIPMILDEAVKATLLKPSSEEETDATTSADFQEVGQLGTSELVDPVAENTNQETLDLNPSPQEPEEPQANQQLEIHGQSSTKKILGSRASREAYSNENLNRQPVSHVPVVEQPSMRQLIQTVGSLRAGLNPTLAHLTTPAFIAHGVSLLDKGLCHQVIKQWDKYPQSDFTMLYLHISHNYSYVLEGGMIPCNVLDDFINEREEALTSFYKSLSDHAGNRSLRSESRHDVERGESRARELRNHAPIRRLDDDSRNRGFHERDER